MGRYGEGLEMQSSKFGALLAVLLLLLVMGVFFGRAGSPKVRGRRFGVKTGLGRCDTVGGRFPRLIFPAALRPVKFFGGYPWCVPVSVVST